MIKQTSRLPYQIGPLIIGTSLHILKDKLIALGHFFPKLPGDSPGEIAKEVIRRCLDGDLLYAGVGHFRQMFPTDAVFVINGSLEHLSIDFWNKAVTSIVKRSRTIGEVPTCFTKNRHENMPIPRVDNLPAVLYLVDKIFDYYHRKQKKQASLFLKKVKGDLQWLVTAYENRYIRNREVIDTSKAGDWMDTVSRPSSSWANIWRVKMTKIAEKFGIKIKVSYRQTRNIVLDKCWIMNNSYRGYFRDHQETNKLGVDACVLSLYLNLFKEKHEAIIRTLNSDENKHLYSPYPMRASIEAYEDEYVPPLTKLIAPLYHSSCWPHLGMMYTTVLIRYGRLKQALKLKSKIDELVMKHRNFPELIDINGDPYSKIMTCEFGLGMAAGIYLEVDLLLTQSIKS